jgi:Cys-tRNA(Pro)/Cys-tRNA(Cys) deacylase
MDRGARRSSGLLPAIAVMSKTTPATLALIKQGINFEIVTYDYDPDAARVGLQAAEALGEAAHRVLKTLVVQVDGRPVCLIIPSDREVSMKKAAAIFGGKTARMIAPADAERITGYKIGGVSPFGQKRKLPTAIEEASLAEPYVFVNGGRRGLQVRIAPDDARLASEAIAAPLIA